MSKIEIVTAIMAAPFTGDHRGSYDSISPQWSNPIIFGI